MKNLISVLPNEQRVALTLRALYRSFGYEQYRMAKFQPYDTYLANKSFLDTEKMITFTDGDGKLLALKPDVTTGIVAGLKADGGSQKLFYVENVFRMDKDSREYREISQLGLESIGGDARYSELEVSRLALASLAEISDNYVLNISNLGFLNGFISSLNLTDAQGRKVLAAVANKNPHDLSYAADANLDECDVAALSAISALSGTADEVLSEAALLCKNEAMRLALSELGDLVEALTACGLSDKVRVDLSMSGDFDYYNGLIMQGYVAEFSRAVLRGGRYDNMLKRFAKPFKGLGFALYLGEVERSARRAEDCSRDVVLEYGDADAVTVARAVDDLRERGYFVSAKKDAADCDKKLFRLTADGVKEC